MFGFKKEMEVGVDETLDGIHALDKLRRIRIKGPDLKWGRSRILRKILVVVLAGCFWQASLPLEAKELTSRLGVGYRNSFPFDLPSLAAVYYPSADFGVMGAMGVDTEYQASKFGVQVGLRKIIFKESQMNFFMGGSLASVSRESGGQTDSGFVLDGLVGSEFFFSGLDSLGINVESGISVANVGRVRFRTTADHLLRAGVIFYF